ncbi:DUF1365 domain-containing protein [Intrasporangium chromatireducens]|uniref:DUF1365 domain-containing protein n=1 Tax=Intrasporangium chromatireducens TaxID=1386088 RepID=UPI001F0B1645|nr:DUF1365 domain-containing protein [Intrasporangium chromatireducens]
MPAPPQVPALVVGEVTHTRRVPVRHAFRHRSYQWLVDLDDLPEPPALLRPLARFTAADHLDGGRLGGGIRGDLVRFLAGRGIAVEPDDRLLMLANARVLGHVFDPLTVFWCLGRGGDLRAAVFEVHNTYGERHAYLLEVDETGRAATDKQFYVSPFNDVSGRYDIRLRLERRRVSVVVGLDRAGERVLTATSRGTPEPATTRALLRVALTHPLMTQRVSALIRFHGIRLWRRLPVLPRPPHPKEAVR